MQTPTDAGEASSASTSTQGSAVDLEIVGSRIIPPPSFQKAKRKCQTVKDVSQKTQVSPTASRSHASQKLTSRAAQEPPEEGKEATRSRGHSKGDQKRVSEALRKKDTLSEVKETSPKNLQPKRPVREKSDSTVSDAKGSFSNLKLFPSEIKVQRKTGIKVERGSAKMVPDGRQSSRNLKPACAEGPEAGYSKHTKNDTSLSAGQTDRRPSSGSRKSTLSHARTKGKPSYPSTDVQENRKGSTGSLQARSALKDREVNRMYCSTSDIAMAAKERSHSQL